jgi:transposase
MALHITAGNINDCAVFEDVMGQIRVPRPAGGRPRARPDVLIGDKGYSSKKICAYLRSRRIIAVIPERSDQHAGLRRRGRSGGHPPAFAPGTYKQRSLVERSFSKLKQFRAGGNASTSRPAATGPAPSWPASSCGSATRIFSSGSTCSSW